MDKRKMDEAMDWLEAELADTLDEDFELELSEIALSVELRRISRRSGPRRCRAPSTSANCSGCSPS